MSAVKNLRAMFEQKGAEAGDSSPPSRGVGSDFPRPLSKVRTSFIAVEKDGRVGLRREGSQDSASVLRKPSGDSGVTTPTTLTERPNPFESMTKSPTKTFLQTHAIFESPRSDTECKATSAPAEKSQGADSSTPAAPDPGSRAPGSDTASDKLAAPESGESLQRKEERDGGTESEKDWQKPARKEATKPNMRTTKPAPKPLGASLAGKPAPKPQKSPTADKAQRHPARTSASNLAAKKNADKKDEPAAEKPVPSRASSAQSKPAVSSSTKKPTPGQSSPATTGGAAKPKSKSPTRPVKLPASLTTHTASSGSKVNSPRQSLARVSSTALPADGVGRSPSRTSVAAAGTPQNSKLTATKGIKGRNSALGRPRPSLGPPPKQPAKDPSPVRKEREVDEGFLARMTRPTQASASRTAAKVQTSPSRKPAAAAAATTVKKTTMTKPTKKVVPKAADAASGKPQSAENQGAADAEQGTEAAERAETAKAVEGAAAASAEADQKDAAQEGTAAAESGEAVEQTAADAKEGADDAASAQPSEASNVAEESPSASLDQPAEEQKQEAEPDEPAAADAQAEEAEAKEVADNAEVSATEEKGDAPEPERA